MKYGQKGPFLHVPSDPSKMKNVGGDPLFSRTQVPLVHHGALRRSGCTTHNVWIGSKGPPLPGVGPNMDLHSPEYAPA